MQRIGNLKVGLVFGFNHPETTISIFCAQQKKKNVFGKLKTETAVSVCSCSSFHNALFPLVLKTTKQLANIQTT